MDSPQDFKSLQEQIQAALISTTRTAGQVSAEDLSFQRSLDPAVGTALDEQSERLLALSRSLLKSATSISQLNAPSLKDLDDVDNNWRTVVDAVDSLLEKADTCLDEYTGVRKRKSPPTGDEGSSRSKKQHPSALGNSFRNQNLLKPQLKFNVKPDNHNVTPWKPLLTSKLHATTPLEESLGTFTDELQHVQYRHPYEPEISQLQYPEAIYEKAEPILYLPVDSTTATYVDTYEGVLEMLTELRGAKEIAVDLEHHDTRSYIGLVSLMQISTREKDWIVDTLKPWRQDLQVLNEVFADPKIIKVFHGAYMDIVWLQRDLGLYIVGLFDTHHASRVLGYPGGSLAYLLKRFVDFDADKKYQMADWRIRFGSQNPFLTSLTQVSPLPDEMFFYARADTHYLLYIFDNLRNELIEKSDKTQPEEDRIEHVLQKSKETSLLRFDRQIYDEKNGRGPGGWYNLLVKTPGLFTNEQFAVFKAVHAWRDQIARKDDESINYVMPNHVIFTLAKLMPVDLVAMYAAVHPISHNVKSRVNELLETIKSAKKSGKDGPDMMDILRPDSVGAVIKAARSERAGQSVGLTSQGVGADVGSLRSNKSRFWGSAFGSSIWDIPTQAVQKLGLRLAVPLPPIASDSLETYTSANAPQPLMEQSSPTAEQDESIEDEAFVIKSARKRAAETPTSSEDTNQSQAEGTPGSYDISPDNNERATAKAQKASRKAEKRAAKQQRKLDKALAEGDSGALDAGDVKTTAEEEQDFDYSKADSVLHSKPRDNVGKKGKNPKPFDPYAKSADAPSGMRRLQTERAGKSFTFKS